MLGERIERRMREIGIPSQSELARRVKVRPTTINSIIRENPRSSPHLVKIAEALKTTPAFLAGVTDDPDEGADLGQRLSSDELEWVEIYGGLTPEQRKLIRALARDLQRANRPAEKVHDQRRNYVAPDQG